MTLDMIRVRMADEDALRTGAGFVRIEPQIDLGQKNSTLMKFKLEHCSSSVRLRRVSTEVGWRIPSGD